MNECVFEPLLYISDGNQCGCKITDVNMSLKLLYFTLYLYYYYEQCF